MNKYQSILDYKSTWPSKFLDNIDTFQKIKNISFSELINKYTNNYNILENQSDNLLYYNIVIYLLHEWSCLINKLKTSNNYKILVTNIHKTLKSNNYSDIDCLTDNILYKYVKKLKNNYIVKSKHIDIIKTYFKSCIKVNFVFKNCEYCIQLLIPHTKEYNNITFSNALFITTYTDIKEIKDTSVFNNHLTILKNIKGFHYKNEKSYIYFHNIETIIDIYIACEINNFFETQDIINDYQILKIVKLIANRYYYLRFDIYDYFDIPPGLY